MKADNLPIALPVVLFQKLKKEISCTNQAE